MKRSKQLSPTIVKKNTFTHVNLFLLLSIATAFVFSLLIHPSKLVHPSSYAASEEKSSAKEVNLILTLVKDPKTKAIAVEKAVANTGYPSKKAAKNSTDVTHYLVDNKNNMIAPINFVDHYISENESHLEGKGGHDPRIALDKPTAYISIPFSEDKGLFVTTKEAWKARKEGLEKKELDPTAIRNALANPIKVERNASITEFTQSTTEGNLAGSENGNYLDILFISSHYTNMNQFQSDANAMARHMLTVKPYSDYSRSIRFKKLNNTQETGCHFSGDRIIACDINRILQIASQTQYDYIVVIENTNQYGGLSYLGGNPNITVTYRNVEDRAKKVMVHELSHTFGDLRDEYSYGIPYNGEDLKANCDIAPPCSKWATIPGTSCVQECTFSNTYRSTISDSLMRTLSPTNGFKYDTVGENAIVQRLQAHGLQPNPAPLSYSAFSSTVYTDNYQRQFLIKNGHIHRRTQNAQGWSNWEDITYFVNGQNQVGQGIITSFNVEVYQDTYQRQFLVRSGNIYRRTQNAQGWSNWEDITYFVNGQNQVGQGTITSFSVSVYSDNYQRQFLTRNGKIYRRVQSANGWSPWLDITSTFDAVGQGEITSFTSNLYQDNLLRQFLVKGNRVYRRDERNWNLWEDITDHFEEIGS